MSLVKIRAALEVALDAMQGLIPAVSISASAPGNPASFTTSTPHQLKTGLSVTLSNHSVAALNGTWDVAVTGNGTFTLRHPATGTAIASAAGGVGGVVSANLTAWEGISFKPLPGVPYQRVHLLPATPSNPSFGDALTRESGIFQVSLCYPTQQGTYDVTTRAEAIRTVFARGKTFTFDGVTVMIPNTPVVIQGKPVDESFVVPVLIPYQADIFK